MSNGPHIEMWATDRVKPYENNPRSIPDKAIKKVAGSLKKFGFQKPIVVDEHGVIIAGHVLLKAAISAGFARVPVAISNLPPAEAKAYRIADNRTAQETDWLDDLLKGELTALDDDGFDMASLGFDDHQLQKLLSSDEETERADEIPEVPVNPVSALGDVWLLGHHKVRCGSSTDEGMAAYWGTPDLVLTDPPYCSGGFQESQRSAGSVGTSATHKQIANDRLSSRGFANLIKASVFAIEAPFFYIFTDWRMWVYLFDVAESSSAGVRSMITWNKGTPGMGLGWRAQHELVMWATRKQPPYAKGFPGLGNVISLPRQKNDLHTTQKPVELIKTLLQCTPFARVVAEPFAGSGTTIMACELEGRSCVASELDPAYVDVCVKRWQTFTGKQATHAETGLTFDEMDTKRYNPKTDAEASYTAGIDAMRAKLEAEKQDA